MKKPGTDIYKRARKTLQGAADGTAHDAMADCQAQLLALIADQQAVIIDNLYEFRKQLERL